VDTTPPTTPVVTDDGDVTSDRTQLHATWASSEDSESRVVEYRYRITEGSATGPVMVDWTSVGTAREVTKTGLTLTHGKGYYFSVQAQNGAGSWSAEGVSDGITVAATPPSPPEVTDDGDFTTDPTQLHTTWTSADSEFGIVEYQYAIGTSAGGTDVVDWTSTGTTTEVTHTGLALTHGTTYYVNVKAKDGAGIWSAVGHSDGIWFNRPPAIQAISPDDGERFRFPPQLDFGATASDPDGDSLRYRFLLDGQVIRDWDSLNLFSLSTQAIKPGLKTLRVEAADPRNGQDIRSSQFYLYRKPLEAHE
jgi:hypothetical protein